MLVTRDKFGEETLLSKRQKLNEMFTLSSDPDDYDDDDDDEDEDEDDD